MIRTAMFVLLPVGLLAQVNGLKIVPGQRVGPITSASGLATLRQLFGAAQVREEAIPDEGGENPGVDYGGVLFSWDGGRLEGLNSAGLWLGLNPDPATLTRPDGAKAYGQVVGDGEFSSSHPAMRALHPRVTRITLQLGR